MRNLLPVPFLILAAAMAALVPAFRAAPAAPAAAPAASTQPAAPAASSVGQKYETETLENGLRVIYAPMPTSPTTHVRVIYHVGSRDERADRQGFAHMFEHMMFRGSEHVAPQEHMKLIALTGGFSNAFTSFDKTVYWQTLPANFTDLALWLEADRMSSFKVSQPILVTERQVIAEEYRMRLNKPYGFMFDELMPVVFKAHPYHWTPIGNMEQLLATKAPELQAFFNKYYVPNNAILVIAGNIDVAKTKEQVKKDFAWIPGKTVTFTSGVLLPVYAPLQLQRDIPKEPPQTSPRRIEVTDKVPLPRVLIAFHMPRWDSDDQEPLSVMLSILGDGDSSRLSRALVTNEDPKCASAETFAEVLEDGGVMALDAVVLNGKSTADVEAELRQQIQAIVDKPVSPEELEKVKQQWRVELAQRFETAEKTATTLGDELLQRGNLDRIATERARLEAMTIADVQRVAKTYLDLNATTTMIIKPQPPASKPAGAAPAAAPPATAASVAATKPSDTYPIPATPPATAPARVVNFPPDFPTKAPMEGKLPAAVFEKGVESTVEQPGSAPVKVIVMEDHRTPTVNFSLTYRTGSFLEPKGKEGLADLTNAAIRRGPKGKTFDEFNEELESRGIAVEFSDSGDATSLSGFSLKELFPYTLNAAKQMMLTPAFDPAEFGRLKTQTLADLQVALDDPHKVADEQIDKSIYTEDSPLGRYASMKSVQSLTLDDVKNFYNQYRLNNAILTISGDISVADAQRAAADFLDGFPAAQGDLPKPVIPATPAPTGRKIFLIDRPQSKQAAIDIAVPGYSIRSDEKFAGSVAGQILSNGIESRLGQYVRAEKGYVYGVVAYFRPTRYAGLFSGETDTKVETTADTITAMFKVFDDMKKENVKADELNDAKFRVSGQLIMTMETIRDQATRRLEGILNGYPIDYYDKYAARIGQVTADEIKTAMNKYVDEDKMTIVVVAPADKVKAQLEKLGTVTVLPMPPQE